MPPVEILTLWFCDRGVFIGLRQEDNFHPSLVSHNADFSPSFSEPFKLPAKMYLSMHESYNYDDSI